MKGSTPLPTSAQWAALSKEERSQILSARKSKKTGDKHKSRNANKNKRKLEAVVKEAAEAISALTEQPSTATGTDGESSSTPTGSIAGAAPADQFGRKAHAIKNVLQSMVTAAMGGKKSS